MCISHVREYIYVCTYAYRISITKVSYFSAKITIPQRQLYDEDILLFLSTVYICFIKREESPGAPGAPDRVVCTALLRSGTRGHCWRARFYYTPLWCFLSISWFFPLPFSVLNDTYSTLTWRSVEYIYIVVCVNTTKNIRVSLRVFQIRSERFADTS